MHQSLSISSVRTFDELLVYLEEALEWPIESMSVDELTFEYDPTDDLRLPDRTSAAVRVIYQLRDLTVEQPFGIFFIEFEASYLPVAVIRRILASLATKRAASANPSDRRTWDVEDLLFISASGQSEKRRLDFAHFTRTVTGHHPELRVLGWHRGEPAPKLEWIDHLLRESLRWPDSPDPERWKRAWTKVFETRAVRTRTAWADLDSACREIVVSLYAAVDLTVDALPYTEDFDWMRDAFNRQTGLELSRHDFWRALSSARKSGQLPRKQR